jgi:hypothetical protein
MIAVICGFSCDDDMFEERHFFFLFIMLKNNREKYHQLQTNKIRQTNMKKV